MKRIESKISEINSLLWPFIGKSVQQFDVTQLYCWTPQKDLIIYENPLDKIYQLKSINNLQDIRFYAILLIPRINAKTQATELLFKKHPVWGDICPSLAPHKINFTSQEEMRSEVRARVHEIVTLGKIHQVTYAGGVMTFKKSLTTHQYSSYIFPFYILTASIANFDRDTFYMAGHEFVFHSKNDIESASFCDNKSTNDIYRAIERLYSSWGFLREQVPARPSCKTTILFLGVNPSDSTRLRLDEEVRLIDKALRRAELRDKFEIVQHWAVRTLDLQEFLLRYKPDIIHFSGHGSESRGIYLEDNLGKSHLVSDQALNNLFSTLNDNVKCVVLNACYSEQQARTIAQNIDCVIGMSKTIRDSSAINFTAAFYQALAYGRDIKTAFDLGCVQIELENLGEQEIPQLISIKSDPSQITLVDRPIPE